MGSRVHSHHFSISCPSGRSNHATMVSHWLLSRLSFSRGRGAGSARLTCLSSFSSGTRRCGAACRNRCR